MLTKYYLPLLLTFLFLTGCSGPLSQESLATQQASPRPEAVASPMMIIVEGTSTYTPIPTITPQIQPSQTSTLIDLETLPNLSQVILSSHDIENLNVVDSSPLIHALDDVTNELQNSCLWDCAKYRYSLDQGILTIMLLRAGDRQKAISTAQTLRKEFLLTATEGGYEYTVADIPNLPQEAWLIVDSPSSGKDTRTSAAGKPYGSIVILVTYSQSFCEELPNGGKYCEGDMMGLALSSVEYLTAQIQKLEAAGFPK